MSRGTSIEWTDDSWNPIRARNRATARVGWHCEHKSEGCRNCYAEGFNARLGTQLPYKPGHLGKDVDVFLDEKMLLLPLRWRKPRKIFVCSMTDLFADFVTDDMLDQVFAVMALCPSHVFQVLTKRPERMRDYLLADRRDEMNSHAGTMMHWDDMPSPDWPLPNVWLGVSVEDQAAADERIPFLLDTPAVVRWLSCEPLLGPVDLESAWHGETALNAECWGDCRWCTAGYPPLHNCRLGRQEGGGWVEHPKGRSGLDWIVVGGESGPSARPMHPDWARLLRDECAAADVPFLFKQWGVWAPGEIAGDFLNPEKSAKGARYFDGKWDHCWSKPDGHCDDEPDVYRLGKKRAGRLLDAVQHDGYPA